MLKSQYDAIITNIGGSGFHGYYTRGVNMKLSDGVTVINIWKPERCPYYSGEVYKDAIIEMSGNSTNRFTYSDIKKINQAIEEAIDFLNKENENLIDREKEGTYEHVKVEQQPKKKTAAIKYADLEIGGVYLDEKKKKWIFLGQGTLLENGSQENRSNDGIRYSEYMYMEYPEEQLEPTGVNQFKLGYFPHPDTYASKKRFFEKVSQLPIDSNLPVSFICGSTVFQCCHGMKPKSYREQMGGMKI